MKIFAVNNEYNGITAGIKFDKGVAFCDDDNLVSWFINAGYRVEEDVKTEDGRQIGRASCRERV